MPVHWYYDLHQLRKDFGFITEYCAPKDHLQNSILSLSNTGGGGRGSDEGEIVGTVILHGKKKYWVRGGNYHYHIGLRAGENTLEAQLSRLMLQCITQIEAAADQNRHVHQRLKGLPDLFLRRYVDFMTTPGSHNDTC